MSNLDLLAPAIAIVALFGVIGLIVQSIRHGRTIREFEERLRDGGGLAGEASLERIRQLQTRARVSSGVGRRSGPVVTILALLLVAVIAGGAWYLATRANLGGGGGDTTASQETPGGQSDGAGGESGNTEGRQDGTTTTTPEADSDSVPEDVPTLENKASATVAIFNASGVTGAAGETTQGLLVAEGYSIGNVANSPDGRTDLASSAVMWTEGNREIAWNVASDLGITSAPALDGLTAEQLGSAQVAVMVGLDLANGRIP